MKIALLVGASLGLLVAPVLAAALPFTAFGLVDLITFHALSAIEAVAAVL